MPSLDFNAVYEANSKLVYWTAYGVVKDEQSAMDAAQNAFLSLLTHEKQLSKCDDAQLRAWLYRVAKNAALDLVRREGRMLPTENVAEDLPVEECDLPESILLNEEARSEVHECVEALPEKYREPISLYYFSGLSYEEIADLLSLGMGTLKSRMSRARVMLSQKLSKGGEKLDGTNE